MKYFRPFIPIHLDISAPHRENSAENYRVFLSLVLETQYAQGNDQLVAVTIDNVNFDPPNLSNITAFNLLFLTQDFKMSNFPYYSISPRDP